MADKNVRVCWGEKPVVYESIGKTPGQALIRMAKKLINDDVLFTGGLNITYDEDNDNFILVAYC